MRLRCESRALYTLRNYPSHLPVPAAALYRIKCGMEQGGGGEGGLPSRCSPVESSRVVFRRLIFHGILEVAPRFPPAISAAIKESRRVAYLLKSMTSMIVAIKILRRAASAPAAAARPRLYKRARTHAHTCRDQLTLTLLYYMYTLHICEQCVVKDLYHCLFTCAIIFVYSFFSRHFYWNKH